MYRPRGHLTLLRHPVLGGLGYPTELFLELPASACAVEQQGALWIVRVVQTWEVVHRGPGPVQVFVTPAPF